MIPNRDENQTTGRHIVVAKDAVERAKVIIGEKLDPEAPGMRMGLLFCDRLSEDQITKLEALGCTVEEEGIRVAQPMT